MRVGALTTCIHEGPWSTGGGPATRHPNRSAPITAHTRLSVRRVLINYYLEPTRPVAYRTLHCFLPYQIPNKPLHTTRLSCVLITRECRRERSLQSMYLHRRHRPTPAQPFTLFMVAVATRFAQILFEKTVVA